MSSFNSGNSCNESNSNPENASDKIMNPHFMGFSSQDGQKQCEEELQLQVKEERYFNSAKMQELLQETQNEPIAVSEGVGKSKKPSKINTSAPTKALNQLGLDAAGKKKTKISMAQRRKKFNQRLGKMLTPRSALHLLQELRPDCEFKVHQLGQGISVSFTAEVELNGEILGTGQGPSKVQAKQTAAEAALRIIVSKRLFLGGEKNESIEETEEDNEDPDGNLPWAGLASFAMYKMFSEWRNQGTNVLPSVKLGKKEKKEFASKNAPSIKDLPPNAKELHPNAVLNLVIPGICAVELERNATPQCRVKMAYEINGQVFSAVGVNKKDAKKEAAKVVLERLYGLTYC